MPSREAASILSASAILERVARALEGLRYGSLELVVHDFKIVRITRVEKTRLDEPEREPR
jgi:hypothetical protein